MTAATWIVLGGSSALARAFAQCAAREGNGIVLAGRDLDDLRRSAQDIALRHGVETAVVALDATRYETHDDVVARCLAGRPGEIGVFLAFGLMPDQAEMDKDPDLARAVVETNYVGALSLLSRFARSLEERRCGRIVVVGSVAGDRGRPKNYVYGSAKAGLHAYAQGLRARLHRSGVAVTTVKPGFLDTAMTFGLPGTALAASPADAAAAIWRAVCRRREVVYVPWFWRWIMAIIRLIPERIFKRLSM